MNLIDTHTHLYLKDFDKDIDTTIKRALDVGVNKFFLPAIDSSHMDKMFALKEKYPEYVYLMAGLHPCYVKENYKTELDFVKKTIETHKDYFHAIGEIGIDLYWDKSFLEEQLFVFQEQINLALHYNLPIVIHCRDAFNYVYKTLKENNPSTLNGIFHCFSGTLDEGQKIIKLGLLLGIGGIVTFKNGKIDTFLSQIPLEKIVLETDAPYLSPVPFRGKRNESSYLKYIVEKIASIYNCSEEKVVTSTTQNAIKVFSV